MTDVHKVTIQTRAPRGRDPGAVAVGWYCVVDNAVVLTDEDGRPLGSDKRCLNPGEDVHLVACRLVRRGQSGGRLSGFNGPMNYPRLRY